MTQQEKDVKRANLFTRQTEFTDASCGCIHRHDGVTIRYCRRDNPKSGTHRYTKGGR